MKVQPQQEAPYRLAIRAGVIAALAMGVVLATSQPTRALIQSACEASFEPPSVNVGSESVTAFYRLSESIGDISRATAEDGSGLQIVGIDAAMSTITLGTQNAEAGDWDVTFHGPEEASCVGSIQVVAPDATAP